MQKTVDSSFVGITILAMHQRSFNLGLSLLLLTAEGRLRA